MTFDEAVAAFADQTAVPAAAIEWVQRNWSVAGPACRACLDDYVAGQDRSERTERALFVICHLLGEQGDPLAFPGLCRLAHSAEQVSLIFGDDATVETLPSLLISTFDGTTRRLHALVEDAGADETVRGETLMVLAFLARTRRLPESELYGFMATLPARLQPREPGYVWYGWVSAVAALGFAGLSAQAEAIFRDGLVDPLLMDADLFWSDLKAAQADPGGMTGVAWERIGPMGSTLQYMRYVELNGDDPQPNGPAEEPLRNPLRHVGRNDPCPCGSGRKFKKCCLVA